MFLVCLIFFFLISFTEEDFSDHRSERYPSGRWSEPSGGISDGDDCGVGGVWKTAGQDRSLGGGNLPGCHVCMVHTLHTNMYQRHK